MYVFFSSLFFGSVFVCLFVSLFVVCLLACFFFCWFLCLLLLLLACLYVSFMVRVVCLRVRSFVCVRGYLRACFFVRLFDLS